MKKLSAYLLGFSAFAFAISACDEEENLIQERIDNNPEVVITGSAGTADYSNYVSLGNSLTAGFMDGALYNNGQSQSFPALLAQQLAIDGIGGGDFNQPDINSENGFNFVLPNPDPTTGAILGRLILDTSIPGPIPTAPGDLIAPFTGDKSTLNNFGVPGILTAQLLTPATGGPANPDINPAYNPFYERFATNPSLDGMTGSTILGDAIATNPSFLSLWIGSNDVLVYASGGASNEDLFTSAGDFQTQFSAVVNSLMANTSANGVVLNVPPITLIPFFRAVPWNPIPLDEATATQLNTGFEGYNAALQGLVGAMLLSAEDAAARTITFAEGANPVVLVDEDLDNIGPLFDALVGAGAITSEQRAALEPFVQVRQTNAADLIPLSQSTVLGSAVDDNPLLLRGLTVPLGDESILTFNEQVAIITRTAEFNGIITAAVSATSGRLQLVDVGPFFADAFGLDADAAGALALSPAAIAAADGTLGIEVGGVTLLPDFGPNGFFSTDGTHPNPRGHAIIANEVIEVLNSEFGSDIPEIDVLALRSVIFQ
ncbi:MAG: hypothetical protein AAFX87_28925 [Bacteroidota bacterium]